MCGRYSAASPATDLADELDLHDLPILAARYNVAPTQDVPAVTAADPHALTFLRWGLIPRWARDPKEQPVLINARAETLANRPSFRDAFREHRCLVVADGFYEWRKERGHRAPFYIRLRSGRPFTFAGIWDVWRPPGGPPVRSCAIVTTEPNELVRPLHDRMPAILPRDARARWLEGGDPAELLALLQPYPAAEMEKYPVSTYVNAADHEGPGCIEPAGQALLFE